ncbi:hypothetical protein V6C27_13865 [Peptococcaceae bacterium 1198_IL3148]
MLKDMVSTFGMLFILIGFLVAGALFIGMMGQWYALQNQAQFIAVSQGKYGGYTEQADNALKEFVQDMNLEPTKVDVYVSAPNSPVPWGTTVKAEVTNHFRFKVGTFLDITTPIKLTGRGRAVSSYMPGTYTVTYTSPSY